VRRIRLVLLIAVAGGVVTTAVAAPLPAMSQLRPWIADAGAAGPLLYLLVYVLGTLVLAPRPVLTVLGGALFGPILGAALALLAGTLAALASFLLVRVLGRDLAAARLGKLGDLDALLASRGWLAVVYLRLLPIIPFAMVNYGFGISSVRTTQFVLGTALGSMPATVLLATAAGTIDSPTAPASYVPLAGCALLGAAAATIARRRRRLSRDLPDEQASPQVPATRPRPSPAR
jgi:uncharacterized membrane protein YdjX (TVP38/TMEM64 family)